MIVEGKNNYIKTISLYGLYLLLSWFFYHLLITLVTFFHFQLDHKVGIIEDWIFDQGWLLVILPKYLSFLIFYKIFTLDEYSKFPLKEILKRHWRVPRVKIFVCISFFWLMQIYLWGMPKKTENSLEFGKYDLVIGNFFLFFLDYFLLFLLNLHYPVIEKTKILFKGLSCSLVFFLSLLFFYPFNLFDLLPGPLVWMLINFLFINLFLTHFWQGGKNTYVNSFLWITFITIPITLFYRFDPIYFNRSVYGVGEMHHYFVILAIIIVYTKIVGLWPRSWRRVSVTDKV